MDIVDEIFLMYHYNSRKYSLQLNTNNLYLKLLSPNKNIPLFLVKTIHFQIHSQLLSHSDLPPSLDSIPKESEAENEKETENVILHSYLHYFQMKWMYQIEEMSQQELQPALNKMIHQHKEKSQRSCSKEMKEGMNLKLKVNVRRKNNQLELISSLSILLCRNLLTLKMKKKSMRLKKRLTF